MRARTVVRAAFLVLAVGLLVYALVREGDAVGASFARLGVWHVGVSALALLAGLVAQMLSWRALFDGPGDGLPVRDAAHVYFVGQLGKYVPGSVWAVVAQTELARRYGLARVHSATVALAAMAVLTVTGATTAAIALVVGSPDAVAAYWWALLVVPVGAVLLWPPVFNRVLALGLRLRRGAGEPPATTTCGLLQSAGWAFCMWALYGVHAWFLAIDLGARGWGDAAVVGGAFALAWVVGFLVIVAPAGAGPREAAFVLALSPVMDTGSALALALASRVIWTLGDAGAAGIAALARRRDVVAAGVPDAPADGPSEAPTEPSA